MIAIRFERFGSLADPDSNRAHRDILFVPCEEFLVFLSVFSPSFPGFFGGCQVQKTAREGIQHKEIWGPQQPPPSKFFM